MSVSIPHELSVVVPVYNESDGLLDFHESLLKAVKKAVHNSYEVIYCDDGSTDSTAQVIQRLNKVDPRVKLIKLSRNFGKENALTAGIAQATGQATIMLDGDGQHPPELIPEFVEQWRGGAKVIIGLRINNGGANWFKRLGSKTFYSLFNKLTSQKLKPGSTDFRLIDKSVQMAFLNLHETDRITRGLIDWLGFESRYIKFKSGNRLKGEATYSYRGLFKLAMNGFVSLTPIPLYLFGILGIFITLGSLVLGLAVVVEQLLFSDPFHWKFTGTAMLSILLLFLVGILLLSQGILSLYISHIHNQSKHRPLYVIDYTGSVGINENT